MTGWDTLRSESPRTATPARLRSGGGARQNAFESSGLVFRNPIRLLSIFAITGIACSGTSPATGDGLQTTPTAPTRDQSGRPCVKSFPCPILFQNCQRMLQLQGARE